MAKTTKRTAATKRAAASSRAKSAKVSAAKAPAAAKNGALKVSPPAPAPVAAPVPAAPAAALDGFGQLFPSEFDIACFIEPAGHVLDVSEPFSRKFGRRPDRWSGATFDELVHPEDLPTWNQALRQVQHAPFQGSGEVRCQSLQGWRWMLWELSSCRDTTGRLIAVRAVGRDVTRRHMAEEQSYVLSQAVEQSPIATAIADADGFVRYTNTHFTTLTGLTLETLLESRDRIFRDLHPNEESYANFLQLVRSGQPWRSEISNKGRHGEPRWEFVQISAIKNPSGTATHLLVLREDITERKLLEEQLRQAQKMESIGTLAGGIAHDFNNLLSVINGYAEIMLSNTDQDERTQRFVREIFKAGQRAVGLVRQILAFSRKGEVQFAPIELNALVHEIAGMLQETFPRTISFHFNLLEELPSLLADQNQMQQIVMNLCVNARDAMPDGGTMTFATSRVRGRDIARLGADVSRTYQCLQVADSGVGMEPEVVRRIFEPFFTTKEKGNGTGLGLAVVEGIVSRHSGFIDVRSTVGKGSAFLIYLPEAVVNQPQGPAETVEAPADQGSGRVLVVEDEEPLRNLVKGVLETRGYEVETASDGSKALQFLEANADRIDCVILDVNMPRLNGISVYQFIRSKFPDLGVIVVSGFLTGEIRQQFVDLGAAHFINKPFRVDEVVNKVNQVLSEARAAT